MKNKNIKNKPQKCGSWLSCILDFQNFRNFEIPDPPFKGNISIKPSNSFFNNNNCQRLKSPPPLKQYTRNLSLGYTEIEKRRRALGEALFCVICDRAV